MRLIHKGSEKMIVKQWIDLNTDEIYTEDEFDDLMEKICDIEYYEDTDSFNDWLDEREGDVEVCGRSYSASDVLRSCDEDAYYDELHSYAENEQEYYWGEIEENLHRMENGTSEWFNNFHIRYIEYEEPDEEDSENNTETEQQIKFQNWTNVFDLI